MNGSAFDLTVRETWAPSTATLFTVSEKAFGPPAMVRGSDMSLTITLAVGTQLTSWSRGPGLMQTGAAEAGAANAPRASAGNSATTRIRNQRVARERMWLT